MLDGWTHLGWPGRTYQKPVAQQRYRLRVFGPLPGRPDQDGEFVMIAASYGNRDHWWIRPESQDGLASRPAKPRAVRTALRIGWDPGLPRTVAVTCALPPYAPGLGLPP